MGKKTVTKEGIEKYNLMVKLFEAVDQRPKAYCIEVKECHSSIYLENKENVIFEEIKE